MYDEGHKHFSPLLRVHGANGWSRDTALRVECFSHAACCERVALTGGAVLDRHQPGLAGTYTAVATANARLVYRQTDGRHFIHYYDWGPNSGCNWMVSDNPLDSGRSVESGNVEYSDPAANCASEVRAHVGPFRVQDPETGSWVEDPDLSIECVS